MKSEAFIKMLYDLKVSDFYEDMSDLKEVYSALMIKYGVRCIEPDGLSEIDLADYYNKYNDDMLEMFCDHINNEDNDKGRFTRACLMFLDFESKRVPVYNHENMPF
jgi:hypothetical protein